MKMKFPSRRPERSCACISGLVLPTFPFDRVCDIEADDDMRKCRAPKPPNTHAEQSSFRLVTK